ncbi:hypothetical protein FB645_004440 [Coemansia sp. IMI 203386]|nr:hypothetical protein FB645_004440 [Coemansia sp. IMI 203386]
MAEQADVYKYFEPTVQQNTLALSNIHTLTSWGVGTAAGVLGLTGLVLFFKCDGKPSVYFKSSFMDVAGAPVLNTLLSYVLVWTLMHALVYIYD